MDESLPGGGKLGQLLLGVLDHDSQLVAQGPLQFLTADWLQADVLVQRFDLLLDRLGQGGAEGAVGLLLGVAAQADEVLVGDLLGLRLRDDQAGAADAAVDGGFEVVRVADGALTVDLAAQDGLDSLEGLGIGQRLVGSGVEATAVDDLAGVERVGQHAVQGLDGDRALGHVGGSRDGQAAGVELGGQGLQSVVAGGVGSEGPGD